MRLSCNKTAKAMDPGTASTVRILILGSGLQHQLAVEIVAAALAWENGQHVLVDSGVARKQLKRRMVKSMAQIDQWSNWSRVYERQTASETQRLSTINTAPAT